MISIKRHILYYFSNNNGDVPKEVRYENIDTNSFSTQENERKMLHGPGSSQTAAPQASTKLLFQSYDM